MGIIDLKPDLEVVERWMRQWPGLPVVVGIRIDTDTWLKGLVEGKCFIKPGCPADGNPDHTDYIGMRRWIWERQGGGAYWANIYFHPNSLRRAIDNKAKAADVGAMTTLHVDCDNAPGEDQETGIARNIELLKKLRGADGNIIMPSDIITSGGGAQAYWRLGAPIPILSEDDLEKLKLYNKHIESELRGDHCHSLDHIMRMPGTINIPHAEKRAKGRLPRLATWEFHDASTRYSLNQFVAAAPENKATVARAFAKDGDDVKFTAESISPTDERLKGLSDKWIKIGLEGGESTDRSKTAYSFVTACMRCSPPVSDEVIASILMDKDWAIGECIRDKGATVNRHRNRIIERAHKIVDEDVEKPCVIDAEKADEIVDKLLIRELPDGVLFWRAEWYLYENNVWVSIDERTMRARIRKFLLSCKIRVGVKIKEKDEKGKVHIKTNGEGKPQFEFTMEDCAPTRNMISEVLDALCDRVNIPKTTEQPCWLEPEGDEPPPSECMRVRNGILHVPSRRIVEHDRNLFSTNITTYDYDPSATCPLWITTLHQYWPLELSQDGKTPLEPLLLQEMFAYSLTPWTALQKIMAVVGPGRSGKGTISKVLEAVIGENNIAAPSFKALGTQFGQQSLINKQLAVIGEAAFGIKDDRAEITNFLKGVSGEDTVNIPRKFLDDWKGRLIARFWLFCNQIPDFLDSGKAIMARMLPLKMVRSWAGKENMQLANQLALELPGILNWSLDGYDRLKKQLADPVFMAANKGPFTMPEASAQTKELFGDLASPLTDFLDEWCIITGKPGDFELRSDVYMAYVNWCDSARAHPKTMGKAIEAIMSLEPERLHQKRAMSDDGDLNKGRPKIIAGMKLSKRPEPMANKRPNRTGYNMSETASGEADTGHGAPRGGSGGRRAPEDEIPF